MRQRFESRRRKAGVFFIMTVVSTIFAMMFFGWRAPLASVPENLDFVPMEVEEAPLAVKPKPSTKPTVPSPSVEGPNHVVHSIDYKMVLIKPGSFMMGSPLDELGRDKDETLYQVTLTKGYYLGDTEVTVGQWRAFIQDSDYKTEAETMKGHYLWNGQIWEWREGYYWHNPGFSQKDDHPVTCVSWNDVQKFLEWLNRKKGGNFRLPTEAEWEYACRAGSKAAFANGDIREKKCGLDSNLDAMGWYCGNSGQRTHPVAQKRANTWDLYDMHGNVQEWCSDRMAPYPSGQVVDRVGSWWSGSDRVVRGGSWYDDAKTCRSAKRHKFTPNVGDNFVGFRLARTL